MERFVFLIDAFSFPVEILSASLFFAHYFHRKRGWPVALLLGAAAICAVSALWPQIYSLRNMFSLTAKYILMYLLAAALVFFAFDCGCWGALYCATAGYCIQHLTYNSFRLLRSAAGINGGTPDAALHVGWFLLVYALAFPGLRALYNENYDVHRSKFTVDRMGVYFSVLFLLSATLLDNYAMMRIYAEGDGRLEPVVNIFLIIIAGAILYIQLVSVATRQRERELAQMKLLLHTQRKAYSRNKELIDSVNLKAHDLKHQLQAMRGRIRPDEAAAMERLLSMYDASLHTGCEALDVVLAEKGLQCLNRGIRFTCLLDGGHLGRFSDTDIYSFFGNAIDNAIEAAEALPEERRVICITENARTGLLNIRIENYCDGGTSLRFVNGLPRTRRDVRYHGFGVKSMRLIAEKYGGAALFRCGDGKFVVDLMLPL